MSIPQVVGTAYAQQPGNGTATISVTPPAGAQSYIALAWPGEHHLLTVPTGWDRKTYWLDGLASAPLNLYYAEASSSPGSTWAYGNYGAGAEWGWVPTVTVLVIGFDRKLTNTWATPGSWSFANQNTFTTASGSYGDDALALSIMGMVTMGTGDPTLAVPSGSWSAVENIEAGPDNGTAVGAGTNVRWDLSVAKVNATGGVVSSLTRTLADGAVSFGTNAGSASVALVLFGANTVYLDITPAAITATPTLPTVPVTMTPAPSTYLDITPAGITSIPTLSTPAITMTAAPPPNPPFVRTVDTFKRYFKDQYGQPILWRMECNWFIAARDPSAWSSYLTTRQAQGYNVIEIGLSTSNDYADTDNGIPMFDVADGLPLNLNQQWLNQMRAFIDAAAAKGMTVMLSLGYGWQDLPGWTTATAFATAMSTAFTSAPNLVWAYGVDYVSSDWAANNPTILAVIAALKAAGDTHLATIQNMPMGKGLDANSSGLSTDNTAFIGKADFEFAYTYQAPYDLIARGWTQNRGPVVLGESNFETENNEAGPATTAETMRRQALWAMTRGAVGWDYGHGYVWRAGAGWTSYLTTAAQTHLTAIQNAFKAIEWWKLAPDLTNAFLTSGQGVKPSAGTQDYSGVDPLESTYATAAVAPDGSVGVVYVPTGRSFTLDLSKLGADRTAYRVDPTTGATTTLTVASSYTSPGSNAAGQSDWLYVFEADPFPASSGPKVTVGGGETSSVLTVVHGGIERAAVATVIHAGAEKPLA